MRALSSAEQAALLRSPLPLAMLVEMDLTTALTLNTSGLDLTISGTTYLGTGGLGKIEAVQDSAAQVKPLRFTLSGVPQASIALMLAEPVQGKAVRLYLAIFDPDSYTVLGTTLRWAGVLDVMALADGAQTATIEVTAEHAGQDLLRSTASLYSNAEQQRLVPGDLSLQFMADQQDMRVVWPTSGFFRK